MLTSYLIVRVDTIKFDKYFKKFLEYNMSEIKKK
jgi:hypothetical protein